jgi:hypothetical protein
MEDLVESEMIRLLRMRAEILRISNEPDAGRRLASWLIVLGPQLRAAPPKRPFTPAASSGGSAPAECSERFALNDDVIRIRCDSMPAQSITMCSSY